MNADRRRERRRGRRLRTLDEPFVHFNVRVPQSLDDRLYDVIYGLQELGVRTSKAELIEMLLWELPSEAMEAFEERLARFRHATADDGQDSAA